MEVELIKAELMKKESLLANIPADLSQELLKDIIKTDHIRIEKIISKGHASPEQGWYDQDENEWVVVIKGAGELTFESGEKVRLAVGDYINIEAHKKHRVTWTDPEEETIWLAIFYR